MRFLNSLLYFSDCRHKSKNNNMCMSSFDDDINKFREAYNVVVYILYERLREPNKNILRSISGNGYNHKQNK